MNRPSRSPLTARAALALAARPDLWATAVRAGMDLAPTGWWRRPPHLPLPDQRWLRFRTVTAYGGDGVTIPISGEDLVAWLEWRRNWSG